MLSGVHDSTITALAFDGIDNLLSIKLMSPNEVETIITFCDIIDINITEFWGNCIIGDIFIWNNYNFYDDYVFEWESGWKSLFRGKISNKQRVLEQIELYKTQYPESVLASIVCSYGGNLSALCKTARISQSKSST